MGYKQHNNPFSRKISSPLRHSVVNSQGKSWSHRHQDGQVKGTIIGGKVIRGDEDFMKRRNRAVTDKDTKTKRTKDGKRATAKNYAKSYADQLARAYNMGAITEGQFLSEEYNPGKGKFELFKDGELIDFSTRGGNIGEGGMYNVKFGERGGLVAPETQVTADEIYDMMVQGGGLVSIVDGKIVAGNPNKVRFSEEGTTGSGYSTFGNVYMHDLADDYIPEGYMTEKAYNDERANNSRRKMTVKELLERRKQKLKDNPINMMKNSPLQSNHDEMTDDQRSDYNISGDPRVNTVTEIVYDEQGRPIGERDITTTEQDYIREVEVPVVNETPPNWQDCYENGVFQTGKIVGSGVNAIKCEMDPDPQPTPEPSIETDQYTDTNVEEVFRPYEPDITITEEEEQPEDPIFEFDLGGGRKKKREFDIELPDIPLPQLGLDQLNILQKKCGGCRQRSLIQRAILALGGGI